MTTFHGSKDPVRARLHREMKVTNKFWTSLKHSIKASENSISWLVVKRMRSISGTSAVMRISQINPLFPRHLYQNGRHLHSDLRNEFPVHPDQH